MALQVGFGNTDLSQETVQADKEPPMYSSHCATGVVLDNWLEAKRRYDEASAYLNECKEHVLNHVERECKIGTNHFTTNHCHLKIVLSETYAVTNDMQLVTETLQQVANVAGGEVASNLITWKPSLNKKVYDMLSTDVKNLLTPILTMRKASPSISVG